MSVYSVTALGRAARNKCSVLVEEVEGICLLTLSVQEPDLAHKDMQDPAYLPTLTHTSLMGNRTWGICLPLEFNLRPFYFQLLLPLHFPFSYPKVLGPAFDYLNVLISHRATTTTLATSVPFPSHELISNISKPLSLGSFVFVAVTKCLSPDNLQNKEVHLACGSIYESSKERIIPASHRRPPGYITIW